MTAPDLPFYDVADHHRRVHVRSAHELIHVMVGLVGLGPNRQGHKITRKVTNAAKLPELLNEGVHPAAYLHELKCVSRSGEQVGDGLTVLIEPDYEGHFVKATVTTAVDGEVVPLVYSCDEMGIDEAIAAAAKDITDWAEDVRGIPQKWQKKLIPQRQFPTDDEENGPAAHLS